MREFKGHHQRLTFEQFEKLLQEIGYPTDGLEVKRNDKGELQDIIIDGLLLGLYQYSTGRFKAANGYTYSWAREELQTPEGERTSATFAEALKVIIEH